MDYAFDTLFDAVEAVSGQAVEQAGVDDVFHLGKESLVFGNGIKNPSDTSKACYRRQYALSIIVVAVLANKPNILLLQMLANIGSIW